MVLSSPDSLPEPHLVQLGAGTVLGWGSVIFCHYSPEPNHILVAPVHIGRDVLIGVNAVVWANVRIGDGAIVQNGAVVNAGTIIPEREIWGGIPARRIRHRDEAPLAPTDDCARLLRELPVVQQDGLDAPLFERSVDAEELCRLLRRCERASGSVIERVSLDLRTLTARQLAARQGIELD